MGADLVSITDQDEMDFVLNISYVALTFNTAAIVD